MNNRAKDLLNKVYDELEKVDVSTLKFDEMKDFLEVVQQGQFLETYEQFPGGLSLGSCTPLG